MRKANWVFWTDDNNKTFFPVITDEYGNISLKNTICTSSKREIIDFMNKNYPDILWFDMWNRDENENTRM